MTTHHYPRPSIALLFLCSILICEYGCTRAGGFADFYQGMKPEEVRQNPMLEDFTGEPEVRTGTNFVDDRRHLEADGFVQIGDSGYNGVDGSPAQAKRQGKWLGARIVMFYSEYTGAESGVVGVTQYNPGQTSYTNSSGYVAGRSGTVGYAGTSTTTTPGTYSTQYVPTTYHRYDYHATYWVKTRGWIFGARYRDLDDSERQHLQRNTGVVIMSLVRGQPAFNANILVGDIILAVNGTDVGDQASFKDLLAANAGTKVVFTVIRGGARKEIDVRLNATLPPKPIATQKP